MRWSVTVAKRRKNEGKNLYLRIRRKVNGRWEESRRSTRTQDPERAKEMAAALEKDLNTLPADGRFRLFRHVLQARLDDMAARRESKKNSITGLSNALKALELILGDVPVEDFGKVHLKRARRELLERLSPVTVRTYEAWAASAWRWAIEEEMITRPWPSLKKVKARATGKKRPYTDQEVTDVLEWVRRYREGFYYPAVRTIADTGRRVSEVLALVGADLRRDANIITIRQRKAGKVLNAPVPVPPSTMSLLPDVEPDAFVFTSARSNRPIRRETIGKVIRKAVAALGIPDGHRLDTHSFRRAFVASAERSGVPGDVGRRITGHETQAMWEHYQSQAVGDDLHKVVRAIHEKRESLSPKHSHKHSQHSHKIEESTEANPSSFKACGESRTRGLIITNRVDDESGSPVNKRVEENRTPNESSDQGRFVAGGGHFIWGSIEPHIETVSRWCIEDPDAMTRLLDDPILQRKIKEAMHVFELADEVHRDVKPAKNDRRAAVELLSKKKKPQQRQKRQA